LVLSPAIIREVLDVLHPVSCDPADDKFLACARTAGAEYLVTEDKDLSGLKVYEGCRICQPAEFIELLSSHRPQAE
jgi:predicted nucleic acid-binding protein